MNDSAFAFFLGFAGLWILLGIGALILLLKMDGQPIKVGPQGLLVALPIVIPFLLALFFGAVSLSR
ncbi:MAG: hypothetical protein WA902_15910 [Thermosynechococcaceae cyanobacterium]